MDKSSSPVEELDLAALVAGDRAEFARLVDRTSSQIYGLALRMLGSTEDAEDVLQETYLKALRARLNLREALSGYYGLPMQDIKHND